MKKRLITITVLFLLVGTVSAGIFADKNLITNNYIVAGAYAKLSGIVHFKEVTSDTFNVYFNHSIKSIVEFNLTESDANEINTYTAGGDKFIFGGRFE